MTGRRLWLPVLAVVALGIGVVAGARAVDPGGEGTSGSGVTHDGEFYWLSDGEIRPDALGAVVAEDVQMMDFRTDLRRVGRLDPDDVLAAEVPYGGRPAWRLIATDSDVGADPWSSDAAAAVILPR